MKKGFVIFFFFKQIMNKLQSPNAMEQQNQYCPEVLSHLTMNQ